VAQSRKILAVTNTRFLNVVAMKVKGWGDLPADQPHEDESQDNVGTGAEISTENDVPAKFYDGPDGGRP
jgi:hypothetical protein